MAVRVFLAFVLVLLLAGAPLRPGGLAASDPALDTDRVAWSRLVYEASTTLVGGDVEITLAPVAPADLAAALIAGSDDAAGEMAPEDDVLLMTTTITIEDVGKTFRTEVWFRPDDAAALQRRRDKQAKEGSRKVLRYQADGVFRLRADPRDGSEAGLPPEDWTDLRSKFFPFGPDRQACPAPSDPAVLLVLASAGAVSAERRHFELCVFNKKALYRADLDLTDAAPLPVDYLAVGPEGSTAVAGDEAVWKVALGATPLATGGLEHDPFELFEMQGDMAIFVARESGLPVKVSGTIPNFGAMDFLLREATLTGD